MERLGIIHVDSIVCCKIYGHVKLNFAATHHIFKEEVLLLEFYVVDLDAIVSLCGLARNIENWLLEFTSKRTSKSNKFAFVKTFTFTL
jgi:hypothetical protein